MLHLNNQSKIHQLIVPIEVYTHPLNVFTLIMFDTNGDKRIYPLDVIHNERTFTMFTFTATIDAGCYNYYMYCIDGELNRTLLDSGVLNCIENITSPVNNYVGDIKSEEF